MKNQAASIRARLLNLARRENQDFQRLLVRFANERLLVRLARSPYADDFILKGATLFTVWLGQPHRATKDIDLLGRGEPSIERLVGLFREIAAIEILEDGLFFEKEGIVGAPIREEARYLGVRLFVPAKLAGARVRLQVDVGMGDAVVPDPLMAEVPSLLNLSRPLMRMYAKETVVAEKLDAMIVLGLGNSRMKDYYDLDLLRRKFNFDDLLVEAIRESFLRRGTPLPSQLPIGLSDAFSGDRTKQTQWKAFLRKAGGDTSRPLYDVVADIRSWLWPVLKMAGNRDGDKSCDTNGSTGQ